MTDLESLAIKLKKKGFLITPHDLDQLLDKAATQSINSNEWIASLGEAVARSPLARDLCLIVNQRRAGVQDRLDDFSQSYHLRLTALRAVLEEASLDWFLLPCTDEHLGEEIPCCAMRLKWLTGFAGSAGLAIIGKKKAFLFVDGRYTEQAEIETNHDDYEIISTETCSPKNWLEQALHQRERVSFDPWLHSIAEAEDFKKCCIQAYAEWIPLYVNPVDKLWHDRPLPPSTTIYRLDTDQAGCGSLEKRANIIKCLMKRHCYAAVFTTPSSIAWLLNIRAHDLTYTPAPLAFAILDVYNKLNLFLDQPIARGFDDTKVTLSLKNTFPDAVKIIGQRGRRILLDNRRSPVAVAYYLQDVSADILFDHDPCLLPKSIKNKAEIVGSRKAHQHDAMAMIRFLAWLETEALAGKVTESSAAHMLEGLRRQDDNFCHSSFATISAAGPNSARAHYRFNEESDHPIQSPMLYLIDSGGHYNNATTDVTRTIAIGPPSIEQKDRNTRVIKGLIRLSQLRFPVGTRGSQIDVIARMPLWQIGLDYDHGTGHGVGAGIEVHEGPQRISKTSGDAILKPGMILSIEPAYYQPGFYGIRQENLVLVVEAEAPVGAERNLLAFETLTLVPFDQELVISNKLSLQDRAWLDNYHRRIWSEIAPHLSHANDMSTYAWLKQATAPLARSGENQKQRKSYE